MEVVRSADCISFIDGINRLVGPLAKIMERQDYVTYDEWVPIYPGSNGCVWTWHYGLAEDQNGKLVLPSVVAISFEKDAFTMELNIDYSDRLLVNIRLHYGDMLLWEDDNESIPDQGWISDPINKLHSKVSEAFIGYEPPMHFQST